MPHPAHPHAKTIERDFGMQQGGLAVTLRAAIAGYVLRQWQVDCSADAQLRGPEFRLWLAEPQLRRVPTWLVASLFVVLVIVMRWPRLLVAVIPLALLLWWLRPRESSRVRD